MNPRKRNLLKLKAKRAREAAASINETSETINVTSQAKPNFSVENTTTKKKTTKKKTTNTK